MWVARQAHPVDSTHLRLTRAHLALTRAQGECWLKRRVRGEWEVSSGQISVVFSSQENRNLHRAHPTLSLGEATQRHERLAPESGTEGGLVEGEAGQRPA